jgi:hypothetical protein
MPALPNIFGQPFIQPSPQSPSPDALASALAGAMPAPTPVPPAEMRRRSNMVSALAAPPQQMTSPWQAVGAAVNGAADGYLDRQTQARSSRPLGRRSPSRMVFRVRSSPPT